MSTTHLNAKEVSRGSVHLDTIRGVAALIVFANHTRALYFTSPIKGGEATSEAVGPYKHGDGVPHGEVKFANEAVIIFFVLSGYLVGGSVLRALQKAQWSWETYLAKRITRLMVVLIPALIIGLTLDYVGMKHLGPGSVYTTSLPTPLGNTKGLASRFTASTIIGNVFFLQTILVPTAGTNSSLWSLTSEFWYYIAFPLGLLALYPRQKVMYRLLYGAATIATLVFMGRHIVALFPLWILGAVIFLAPWQISTKAARAMSAVVACLLVLSMLGVRLAHLDVVPAWYVIGVLSAVLIFLLSRDKQTATNGLYKKTASYFSQISYSLYLFHLPMATFICGVIDRPWQPWSKTHSHLAAWIVSDLFILGIVTVLWRLFEARTDSIREFIFKPAAKITTAV